MHHRYPFSAIVGQDEMKLALLIAATDPAVGGVLIFGQRGTAKSTAVRALPALLPKLAMVADCPYGCDPGGNGDRCDGCRRAARRKETTAVAMRPIPVVDLPLGATEDRVVGSLDLERALRHGERRYEPGLLAKANRGFLYVDEINLLDDHLVDLLLDVAVSGENVVERDGLSVRHPARFVLVGSGNPEEGDLRPQLLDRFGLAVDVVTPNDPAQRIEVVRRRDAFDRAPNDFLAKWRAPDTAVRKRLTRARETLDATVVPDALLERGAALCAQLKVDGVRGELTLLRAARAVAALDGVAEATLGHLRQIAPLALRHRLRRDPLDDTGSSARIERAVRETIADTAAA